MVYVSDHLLKSVLPFGDLELFHPNFKTHIWPWLTANPIITQIHVVMFS